LTAAKVKNAPSAASIQRRAPLPPHAPRGDGRGVDAGRMHGLAKGPPCQPQKIGATDHPKHRHSPRRLCQDQAHPGKRPEVQDDTAGGDAHPRDKRGRTPLPHRDPKKHRNRRTGRRGRHHQDRISRKKARQEGKEICHGMLPAVDVEPP